MKRRHPGCALLLKRMMLVKAVPAFMSQGRKGFPLLMARMAEVSLASSSGFEKGSQAVVGVDRLNPIACSRIVDVESVVNAGRC